MSAFTNPHVPFGSSGRERRRMIWVTFQRRGLHFWTNAPEETAYLRSPHRHVFRFRVWIAVGHDDREIEFHAFQSWLENLYDSGLLELHHRSCEMLAGELYGKVARRHPGREVWIEVAEDGENGSFVQYPAATVDDVETSEAVR